MAIFISIVCLVLFGALIHQRTSWQARERALKVDLEGAIATVEALTKARNEAEERGRLLAKEVEELAPFREVRDATLEAEKLRTQADAHYANAVAEAKTVEKNAQHNAEQIIAKAKGDASNIRNAAEVAAQSLKRDAEIAGLTATRHADSVIKAAQERAEQIAGDAYKAITEAESLKQVAKAMQNVIDGYGDRYLVPTMSLIDDLAEEYSFDDAGQQLKLRSPIIYREQGSFADQARQLLPAVYSCERGIHHYRSAAVTTYRQYLKGDLVPLKKYFYALRPLLSVRWLEKYSSAPPIEFDKLLHLIEGERELVSDIQSLLVKKSAAPEMGLDRHVARIDTFIESELARLESVVPDPSHNANALPMLNALFLQLLEQTWGGGLPLRLII